MKILKQIKSRAVFQAGFGDNEIESLPAELLLCFRNGGHRDEFVFRPQHLLQIRADDFFVGKNQDSSDEHRGREK